MVNLIRFSLILSWFWWGHIPQDIFVIVRTEHHIYIVMVYLAFLLINISWRIIRFFMEILRLIWIIHIVQGFLLIYISINQLIFRYSHVLLIYLFSLSSMGNIIILEFIIFAIFDYPFITVFASLVLQHFPHFFQPQLIFSQLKQG